MRLLNVALAIVFTGAAHVAAQQPRPGVWFGISPSRMAPLMDDRFQIEAGATGLTIVSAPFGKTPVSWGPIALKLDGSVEFHWPGTPPLLCALRRTDPRNYEGTCKGSGKIERRLTLSRNQPSHGLELPVSNIDFRILERARKLLSGPAVWNRADDRTCEDDAKKNSWSLFCALYQSSVDVAGAYVHLRPVMEEVRAVLGEVTKGRSFGHPLMDYNNLESTTYNDITTIFDRSEKRLQVRKACTESHYSEWSVSRPYKLPIPKAASMPQGEDVRYWGEGLAYTEQRETYLLSESLGPMTASGKIPADWLAASTSVTRRIWKRNDFDGVDLKGKLANGHLWRYFRQCGESWKYYDVPARAAGFFDRIIDGSYFHAARR